MRFRVHIRPPSVHAEAHPLDGEKARIRKGGAKFKASKQAAKLRGHQADACSQYCGASCGKLGLYMAHGAIKIECAIYCSILIQYWLKSTNLSTLAAAHESASADRSDTTKEATVRRLQDWGQPYSWLATHGADDECSIDVRLSRL